jgi:acetyl esterase/lipase
MIFPSDSVALLLVFQLPYQFVRERYLLKKERKTPFVQRATVFEDIVIRCVRYAFANIPARIGRVFFQKWVVYPFFRFRLLRHGYLTCPVAYHEINRSDVKGIWISDDRPEELEKPDLVVYYCHGGGFSMGSSYFYLEFLISWLTLLKEKGFQHPAIFALEDTLVPDETWPKQFEQVKAGYTFLNSYVEDSSKICLSGDSAGATLVLSRLLHNGHAEEPVTIHENEKPGIALLLSPWTHLVSEELNRNTPSDYLDSTTLHLYARQYAGNGSVSNPVMSPGLSEGRWNAASPEKGYHIIYGAEEVFALGIEETVRAMKRGGAAIETTREDAGIHAWPVVNLFLADEMQKRLKGLERMSQVLWLKMRPSSS